MKLILSKKESQSLDKLSNSKKYISSDKLMNNAGKLSAQYFVENIQNPFNKKVLVIAGNGNNGSDAFIMHYYLKKYGVNSKIFFLIGTITKNYLINITYLIIVKLTVLIH